MIQRIVSGGQTGVDRAALDWAIARRIEHGGWCPSGRKAEDGIIPDRYKLTEIAGGYDKRTRANVRDSDATLIISLSEELEGGTLETRKYAGNIGKPCLHVWPHDGWENELVDWVRRTSIAVLNVAGPRASKAPDISPFVEEVLDQLLASR